MAPEATVRHRKASPSKASKPSAATNTTASWVSKRHSKSSSAKHAQTFQAPPFTLKELRDAVPAECFKHNTLISLGYVAWDLALAGSLFYLATGIDNGWGGLVDASNPVVNFLFWCAYWVAQGVVCTGIWVIAHECGHGGFSAHRSLNHAVGWVLHSALLVPYFSWKITHGMHHKGCGNMDKDQVFVPHLRSDLAPRVREEQVNVPEHSQEEEHEGDMFESAPIVDLLRLLRQQLFGWPAYILMNVSGQRFGKWASHFHTTSPIFTPDQANQVILSDLGIFITLSILGFLGSQFGFMAVVKYYVIPYFWVNHWLVMITFLQHTDVRLPHYRGAEWTFLKGALCTVDRDFGILNFFFHRITDTHVVHHLFSNMPFYNAGVATEAVKAKLGDFYLYDNEPIFWSLWNSYRSCRFVEDEGNVLFYKR
ncbi:delta-12 fatty acid desaturase [Chytriomyces cf. hyalinus JEL632]|nr:delta-12 fatty acid desaturase [Chytriomyces cf. hyalinus JEL632]